MKIFKNAFDAYYWVSDHPKLMFARGIEPWMELTPHMVNPINGEIDDDATKNTELHWWVEGGGHHDDEMHGLMRAHDWDLDDGGKTADEAVIKFAENVLNKFGDYS
jgi:hypothetical protein